MLNVVGRRCLVVGGGAVGARRARALVEAGATVVVVAPETVADLDALPVDVRRREVEPADLDGCFLVVIATPHEAANARVATWAEERRVLVNAAADPARSGIDFMAHSRRGPLTLAVHTGGVSATAATAIRDELDAKLDPVWPRLLELAGPYRPRIQAGFADARERAARLRRLTDADAIAILRGSGEPAFRAHCEALATP